MLRVYFPAGHPITETQSHSDFATAYHKEAFEESERCSVTLLSRIFSLLNVDLGDGITLAYKNEHLDYDLALFNSYTATFKRAMRFNFQSIMYRTLREQRCDIETIRFQEAVESLAFKKTNAFSAGLLMKSMLMRKSLNLGPAGSIYNEFGIQIEHFDKCLT